MLHKAVQQITSDPHQVINIKEKTDKYNLRAKNKKQKKKKKKQTKKKKKKKKTKKKQKTSRDGTFFQNGGTQLPEIYWIYL